MKKIIGFAVLTMTLLLSGMAQAEQVDFGKMPCEGFEQVDADTMTGFYFWLNGYVSAKTNDTIVDTGAIESDLKAIFEYCKANPKKTVLSMVE